MCYFYYDVDKLFFYPFEGLDYVSYKTRPDVQNFTLVMIYNEVNKGESYQWNSYSQRQVLWLLFGFLKIRVA